MNLKLGDTLLTLQNSKPTEIPQYAYQQLQAAKDQLKRLNQEVKKINQQMKSETAKQTPELDPFRKAKFALLLDQIYRIKRFLLIYHNFRCDRLEDQFWHFSAQLNNKETGNLSDPEKQYFSNYKTIVTEYIDEIGLDLKVDLDPPLESEVEVRILEDCGELMTDNGEMVKLEKNAVFYISRRVIEPYVKQGQAVILKR